MMPTRKNMSIISGDTLSFGIKIFVDSIPNSIYFSCSTGNTGNYVFQKSLNNGIDFLEDHTSETEPYVSYRIRVAPEDTKNTPPMEYLYDMQITINDKTSTILYGYMNILPGVTI